jgi:NAD(P) transhydrogenase subunit beta
MLVLEPITYIIASCLFIFSIRGLASPKTAKLGNTLGMIAMIPLAIGVTLLSPNMLGLKWIALAIMAGALIGTWGALKVKMTSLPQMVAAFNGFGGLSSVLVAIADTLQGSTAYIENSVGLLIGSLAFSGSIVAFAKLQGIMSAKAITFPLQRVLNLSLIIATLAATVYFCITGDINYFYAAAGMAILLGFLLIIPIGGADMPVVISVLNSYSGWAAVGIGFSLNNVLLIITGSIVGASGAILSYIMCKAMNRSLMNVLLGGFGQGSSSAQSDDEADKFAQTGNPDDAAFLMENSNKVIIVPGYGMAVAQAQHVLNTLYLELKNRGVDVKFAIHPVAGRMPGHMNVLLAEANIPYEDVYEMSDINKEFSTADVAFVIGANDVTNPLAKTDPSSPIYGMPILEVEKAKTIFFVKRSLASGYSGVDNPLFYAKNTMMLYGDAKKVTEQIVAGL